MSIEEVIENVISQFAVDSDSESNMSNTENNDTSTTASWAPVDGSNLKTFEFNVSSTGIKHEYYNLFDKNPYDFYKIFITDDIITKIVQQTNLYAQQKLVQKTPSQKSKSKSWVATDAREMEIFFGILIWMGLVKTPQLRDYWSKNFLFQNNVCKIMTRNRFEQLLSMWHFSDNDQVHNAEIDRLHKLTPLLKSLVESFEDVITPGINVCIDETMVPFRGRLKFKQYIKNKRHKFGIKLYKLCLQNGYTYNIKVYCGNDKGAIGNASFNVVFSLMENLLDCGRTLYTDNYYTSVHLARELAKRQTHIVGTVRFNRKLK